MRKRCRAKLFLLLAAFVAVSILLSCAPSRSIYGTSSSGSRSSSSSICSGCGGSGRGSDYLRRQGLPQAPGFSQGQCPRCYGSGKSSH
jgi:hypothetical protein